MNMPVNAVALVLFLASAFISQTAGAEVVAYDALTVKSSPLMLRAKTMGRFFSKGGELVGFSVDGAPVGRTLSGGDGVALMEFKPEKTGLYRVKAVSGGDEDTGYVLSLAKGDEIVFVEVPGALFSGFLSDRPREGAQEAIKRINGKFSVVYLKTGFLGIKDLRGRLREGGYPEAPLIDWAGGRVFSRTDVKGIKIKAVIGSPDVAESARKYGSTPFVFNGQEGEKGWKDIADSLLAPPGTP